MIILKGITRNIMIKEKEFMIIIVHHLMKNQNKKKDCL